MRTQHTGLLLTAFVLLVFVGISLWGVLMVPRTPTGHGAESSGEQGAAADDTDLDDDVDAHDDNAARGESEGTQGREDESAQDEVTPQAGGNADEGATEEVEEAAEFNVDGEWQGRVVLRGRALYGDTGEAVVAPLALELVPRANPDQTLQTTATPDERGAFEASLDEVPVRLEAFHAELRLTLVPEHEDARPPRSDGVEWHARLATSLDTDDPTELGTVFLWDMRGDGVVGRSPWAWSRQVHIKRNARRSARVCRLLRLGNPPEAPRVRIVRRCVQCPL